MKWTESATKHWSTRTAVSNTEILSPPNKYTFWTASIWHGTWHIHLWKVLQSRSYCIGCISPLSHCVDALHSRPTRMQSSIWWLHSCIAQLHTLNTVLIAQCRVQLSAHYAQLVGTVNCTMLNVTRLVHVTMLDVTEQFWPKIWSHFRCCYCSQLHRPDFQLY